MKYNKKEVVGRPQQFYKDLPIDSHGEEELCIWMQECKENGLIKDYRRGKSYMLSDVMYNNYAEQLKTMSKPKAQLMLRGHSYNLDFEIEWTEKGKELFCNTFGEKWTRPFFCDKDNISFIEAKPNFDFKNMERLAVLNIKWVWDRYKIFIQILTNEYLFRRTFVPKDLLYDKKGKLRKYKFQVKTIDSFLN